MMVNPKSFRRWALPCGCLVPALLLLAGCVSQPGGGDTLGGRLFLAKRGAAASDSSADDAAMRERAIARDKEMLAKYQEAERVQPSEANRATIEILKAELARLEAAGGQTMVDPGTSVAAPLVADQATVESLTAQVQVEGQAERDANLKAAAAGDSAAMYKLGRMYAEGTGVEKKDYAQARSWFTKAAEAGNGAAMNSLGAMYQNGLGVEKSDLQAAAWYEKGAHAGDASAMGSLGFMYAQGLGVAQDDAKALEWTRKAAEAGSPAAMCNLGFMYADGRGVAKDMAEARKWMEKASASIPAAKKWLADQGP